MVRCLEFLEGSVGDDAQLCFWENSGAGGRCGVRVGAKTRDPQGIKVGAIAREPLGSQGGS